MIHVIYDYAAERAAINAISTFACVHAAACSYAVYGPDSANTG